MLSYPADEGAEGFLTTLNRESPQNLRLMYANMEAFHRLAKTINTAMPEVVALLQVGPRAMHEAGSCRLVCVIPTALAEPLLQLSSTFRPNAAWASCVCPPQLTTRVMDSGATSQLLGHFRCRVQVNNKDLAKDSIRLLTACKKVGHGHAGGAGGSTRKDLFQSGATDLPMISMDPSDFYQRRKAAIGVSTQRCATRT